MRGGCEIVHMLLWCSIWYLICSKYSYYLWRAPCCRRPASLMGPKPLQLHPPHSFPPKRKRRSLPPWEKGLGAPVLVVAAVFLCLCLYFPEVSAKRFRVCQMKLEDRKSQRLGNHNSQGQATGWSYLSNDVPTLEKCRQPSESNLSLMCIGLANFANLTHDSIL